MSQDLNPYQPPSVPKISLLWDRSTLAQFGFGIHMLVMLAYCFITVESDRRASEILAGLDGRFNVAMTALSALGFAIIFATAITKTAWPLHQRSTIIAIDLLLIGLIAYVSQGFGTLCD